MDKVQPTVSSAALNLVFRQLHHLGIDEDQVLTASQFSREEMNASLHERIPLEKEILFWRAAKNASKDELFHLKLASKTGLGDFLWGDLLFASAADVYTGIRLFEIFASTINESWTITTESDGEEFRIVFELNLEREFGVELVEFGMVNTFRRILDISSTLITPKFISLKRLPSDEAHEVLKGIFPSPIQFGCDRNMIVFSAKDLLVSTKKRDEDGESFFHEVSNAYVNLPSMKIRMTKRHFAFFKGLITRSILSHSLLKNFTINSISEEMSKGERSVQRVFSSEKTNFRSVFLDIKMVFASFYLKSTSMPIKDIGKALGYSNESNFLRTFKKKFGKTPSEFRHK